MTVLRMKNKQNITIKIADVAPISMTILPETEEIVRTAERKVNEVWTKWSHDFEGRTSKEVLAMVTFQFAKAYYQLMDQVNRQEQVLTDFENRLDSLLDIADRATSDPRISAHGNDSYVAGT